MRLSTLTALFALLTLVASPAFSRATCKDLPSWQALQKALERVVVDGNGGIFKPNAMWATLVDRDGTVCAVAKTGDAWPGSRVISAQKANTANAFSNERLALSTANLYSAVQPGGSLFGLQHSNPVNTVVAYAGEGAQFGSARDPLVGKRPGGVNVFGGGLALYGKTTKEVLGGLGVSGDSSCADHIIAWRLRQEFALDHLPGGVSPANNDNIIHDLDTSARSRGGFGHPTCGEASTKAAAALTLQK